MVISYISSRRVRIGGGEIIGSTKGITVRVRFIEDCIIERLIGENIG